MTVVDAIHRRVSAGEVVVLDGGMGTELEARGVPMDDHAWSANANVATAELVRLIHEDYIRAGAEVIITNTYAAARPPLTAAGLADRVEEINRGAAEAAIAARDHAAGNRPVAIAGSLSHVLMGDSPRAWPTDSAGLRSIYREQASVLAESGADVLVVEMATAAEWVLPAVDAALDTGLPVWVGLSFEQPQDDGIPTLRGNPGESLDGLLQALIHRGVAVLFVMHTEVEVVDHVLPALVTAPAPVGVYPHSGKFVSPRWTFGHVSPDQLASASERWMAKGATLIGGCCGTTPAHIDRLADEAQTWNAARDPDRSRTDICKHDRRTNARYP